MPLCAPKVQNELQTMKIKTLFDIVSEFFDLNHTRCFVVNWTIVFSILFFCNRFFFKHVICYKYTVICVVCVCTKA